MKAILACAVLAAVGCGRTAFDEEEEAFDLGATAVPDFSTEAPPLDLGCGGDAKNACGKCAPPPVEECNGRDDDCDGLVDEKCATRLDSSGQAVKVRIDGDRAVIQTGRDNNGDPGGGVLWDSWGTTIRLIDVPARQGTVLQPSRGVTDAGQYFFDAHPTVDGDQVVWYFSNNQSSDSTGSFTLRDLATSARHDLVGLSLRNLSPPALSSGRVAFSAQRATGSDYDVYLWSPPDPSPRPLTFPLVEERSPDLDGDWLVYERRDVPNGSSHVRALNLADGRMRWPSENLDGTHTEPAISGTRVVWTRFIDAPPDPARYEIWFYDLATDERRLLQQGAIGPRIDGNLVCWSASNNSQWPAQYGVSAHDLASGRTLLLAGHGRACDVSGRRVVWIDSGPVSAALLRELLPDEP